MMMKTRKKNKEKQRGAADYEVKEELPLSMYNGCVSPVGEWNRINCSSKPYGWYGLLFFVRIERLRRDWI